MTKTLTLGAVLIGLCSFAGAQSSISILEDSLPPLSTGKEYHVQLHATGIAPPFVWSVIEGDLPEGINLSADGVLSGRPTKPGGYSFTLKVDDSGHPPHSATREFHPAVSTGLLLDWLDAPKVHDNRIDGSVQVSNGSRDTYDLTVVIVAVASADQRATAIGYERFDLKPGANNVRISFGQTLPAGGYVVHADAIAEIPERNTILRQRLQSSQALQIAVGP
ncbi:MAG: putative Ig domain-containing protein [Terriglobales bacterium]